jgi:myo-inositol 2-dehydrogenase / D-chiro-inositol 1-dehydrogenase
LEEPQATGEDGKVTLEAVYAAYASAGLGQKVLLPYKPTAERPVEEWLNRRK